MYLISGMCLLYFATDYDIKFNITKTSHIVVAKQFTENNNIRILLRDEVIKHVKSDKHLGNITGTNINKAVISSAIHDFIMRNTEILCWLNTLTLILNIIS